MNSIKKILITVFIVITSLLLFIPSVFSKSIIRTIVGTVAQVIDGDTLKLNTPEGTRLTVRLYGIDAPETEKYNRKTGKISKPSQPFGEEAYRALQSKVLDKKIRLDVIDIDKYKRTVGIIYLDSRNINLELIKEGLAWAYKEYLGRPYASEFLDTEREARDKKLGLWQQHNPQPPWEFRKLMKIR